MVNNEKEMKKVTKYLHGMPYSNLKYAFLKNVNQLSCFIDLFGAFEDANKKALTKFMESVLANEWTLEEVKEMMS